MKSKNILLITLTSLLLLSCSKFLDVKPKDYASDEFTITDQNSAETALNGTYRSLAAPAYYGTTFQFIIYLQGGDLGWGDSRTVNREFIQNNVRADNEEVANAWKAIYKTINQTNHLIEKVPATFFAKAEDKNRVLGEAYFIRALNYFDLARTWGGVQLILKPTVNAKASSTPRSSLDETYAQVISDLEQAETLLPDPTVAIPPSPFNRIRATKKTVYALKARYYLYRKDWAKAEEYASKIIDDVSNFKLVTPFNAWFANNAKNTGESVFETNYSDVSATVRNNHRNSWQPPINGGIRSWFPDDELVSLLNDSTKGGTRKAFIAKTAGGLWYGNLYYRFTDPSYLIRSAELYLIRAEARAQLNRITGTDGALVDVNAIRTRAGLANSAATNQEETLLAIEQERRLEFPFEPHRWFDLVRTDRADEVLNLSDPNKYVLPIPIGQIIIDPALKQNPGY